MRTARVNELREELAQREQSLAELRRERDARASSLSRRRAQFESAQAGLAAGQTALSESVGASRKQRDQLWQAANMLRTRQKGAMVELHAIFPIVETAPRQCTIAGLPLGNGDFSGVDEEIVATALGYVAHLVHRFSKYMDLPLRFPITPAGSRASVRDDNAPEREREFPLYSKGRERASFDYAVFLLDKARFAFCIFSFLFLY